MWGTGSKGRREIKMKESARSQIADTHPAKMRELVIDQYIINDEICLRLGKFSIFIP